MRIDLRIGLLAVGLTLDAYCQGYMAFNNFTPNLSPITISTAPGGIYPADGPPGAFLGSNYSASLLKVSGIVTNQTTFDSLIPILIADAVFFGTTGIGPGHGIGGDGSGFFEGGTHLVTGLTDFYATFQVRAWYNGGGVYASYADALAAGHNVGQSKLLPLYIMFPPGPVNDLRGLEPFTVGIPEPPTFVLAALGGAALLLFRLRR